MTPSSTALDGLATTHSGSLAEQLAAAVEQRVQDDRFEPGSPLGTIDDLQHASGYSRPTVGEAIRLLRDRGVIRIKPGRGGGLFVADRGPVVRLRHTLLAVEEEPATVVEAIELREHLELLIDLGAARCRSARDIAALRRLLRRLAAAPDWQSFLEANWALHERIAAICPNTMARAVYVGTLGHITATSGSYDDGAIAEDYRDERQQVHVELVEAIASGKEDRVRAAVARHAAAESGSAR